jgi:hypothetical protein
MADCGPEKVDYCTDFGHRLAVLDAHQHVGRRDVAVDDAFLVGVLDRWQTGTNSSSRSRRGKCSLSQYLVIGTLALRSA